MLLVPTIVDLHVCFPVCLVLVVLPRPTRLHGVAAVVGRHVVAVAVAAADTDVGDAVVRTGGAGGDRGGGVEGPVQAGAGGHRRGRRVLAMMMMHHLRREEGEKLVRSLVNQLKASFLAEPRERSLFIVGAVPVAANRASFPEVTEQWIVDTTRVPSIFAIFAPLNEFGSATYFAMYCFY